MKEEQRIYRMAAEDDKLIPEALKTLKDRWFRAELEYGKKPNELGYLKI